MSEQVAGLRVDVDTAAVETAAERLDRFTNRAKMTETQIKNLESVAKRNNQTFEEVAIRFGEAADRFHGLDDATKKATSATESHAKATESATGATGKHNEELTRLEKVMEVLHEKNTELASNLGVVGQVFSAIGPAGFGLAIALGAVYETIKQLGESAERMSGLAKALSNVVQITGLTGREVQALSNAGTEFGLTATETGQAITRFTQEMSSLRDGSGRLATELRKIDPALLAQLSAAETTSEALTLLSEAYEKATTNKNKLAQAAFGRDKAPIGQLLGEIADKGSVDALAKSVNQLDLITDEQRKTWHKLGVEIEDATGTARNNVASIYTTQVLTSQKNFATGLLDISRTLKEFSLSPGFQKMMDFFTNPVVTGIASAVLMAGGVAAVVAGAPIIGGAIVAGGVVAGTTALISHHGADVASEGASTAASTPTKEQTKAVEDHATAQEHLKESLGNAATASRLLTGALGSAATPSEQLKAKTDALKLSMENGELGAKNGAAAQEAYNRALAGLNLDAATAMISARVGALGAAASETDLLTQKSLSLTKANQQGAGLTDTQIANQMRLTTEQYNGVAAVKAQTDAAVVANNTIGMSVGATAEYVAVRNKVNEAIRNGQPLNEAQEAALRKEAKSLGDAAQAGAEKRAMDDARFASATMFMSETEKQIAATNRQLHGNDWADYADSAVSELQRINAMQKNVVDLLKSSVGSFANDVVSGLTKGKSLMESLGAAARNLSTSLTSKAFTNLLSGDFVGAAVAGVGAVITGIFAGQQEAREAEEKAAKEANDRIAGYRSRAAAAVIDTTTMAGQLAAFDAKANEERQQEAQKGGRALVELEAALAAERSQLLKKSLDDARSTFKDLVQIAPSAVQSVVKTLSDAAVKLATVLGTVGQSIDEVTIGVEAAVTKLQHNFADSLISKINAAFGADYLSTVIGLARQHTTDLADAASLGINASLVNQSFSAQVQKLINDGRLTGEAFNGIITLFPELSGQVHAFSSAAEDASKVLADAITTAQTALQQAQQAVDQAQKSLTSAFQSMLNSATSALAASVNNLTSVYKTQYEAAQANVVAAYNAQTGALQSTIDKMKSFIVSLKQFQTGLMVGSLSTLNPTDQLGMARSNFEDTAGKAGKGDATAIAALQGVSQTYLDQAKSYFASSDGYAKAFQQVQDALKAAQIAAQGQISDAEKQMGLLKDQITALGIVVDNTAKINENSIIAIAALGTIGSSTAGLDANGKALNSAVIELQKIQVLGQFIQQQYGITIDTSIKSGTALVIDAINGTQVAYQNVVAAINLGTQIQKQTGVDVFAGLSTGTAAVVDIVRANTAAQIALSNSQVATANAGFSGTILAVNGTAFAVFDAGTRTITAVSAGSALLAAAIGSSASNVGAVVNAGLTGSISVIGGQLVAISGGTNAAIMGAAGATNDAITRAANSNGAVFTAVAAGTNSTIAGYTTWAIQTAGANTNSTNSTIAGYTTWAINNAQNLSQFAAANDNANAAAVIAAVNNITNANNGTGSVTSAVNVLTGAQAQLVAAQQTLMVVQANQAEYAKAQINVAASSLSELIMLNANVIALSQTVAASAHIVPASSDATDAAARAAAAAREAAKTWHYPTSWNDVGQAKEWAMETTDGPAHAAYRAAHPEARYEAGGVVANGRWGKDSVNAMLAGGEFVMPAPQTAQFLPQLEAMRAGGKSGGDDIEKLAAQLIKAMAGISMGEMETMKAENAALREQITLLINAVRNNKGAPARPNYNNGLAA